MNLSTKMHPKSAVYLEDYLDKTKGIMQKRGAFYIFLLTLINNYIII